ncbi:MAG: HIT family protein [Pseudoflavonifractor sp.]
MPKQSGCFYCDNCEPLFSLMTEVCTLKASRVFFFRDQKNPGRCVVLYKDHKTELFQLTSQERGDFMDDVAAVAKAVWSLYAPQKINYATYGDTVPHLHVHVVPKTENGVSWGGPFSDQLPKVFLTDEAQAAAIGALRAALKG